MARHSARDEDQRLRVVGDDDSADSADGSGAGEADAETYGLRVVWQSEAELLEAAEFLLATRTRRDESLRVLHDVGVLGTDEPEAPTDDEPPRS